MRDWMKTTSSTAADLEKPSLGNSKVSLRGFRCQMAKFGEKSM
jgi:hypothetical protein